MLAQPSWPALVFTVSANDMYRAEAFHATNMHTLNMHVRVKKRLLHPPKPTMQTSPLAPLFVISALIGWPGVHLTSPWR
jgi:hypothetical protein